MWYLGSMIKNNLRKILKTQGRSIAWLARESKLSRYKVEATMYGLRQPRIDEMLAIARALQLPLEVIFFNLGIPIGTNENASMRAKRARG